MISTTSHYPFTDFVSDPGEHRTARRALVVDDDEGILELSRVLILGMGWEVSIAGTGESALRLFSCAPELYAFALLDLSLPHMQGTELARRLKDLRPDLPIIMATGHGEDILASETSLNLAAILRKPYRFADLELAVRSATAGLAAA